MAFILTPSEKVKAKSNTVSSCEIMEVPGLGFGRSPGVTIEEECMSHAKHECDRFNGIPVREHLVGMDALKRFQCYVECLLPCDGW